MNNRYSESLQLWENGKKFLVPGSMTISKHANLYPFGAYPIYITSGKGSMLADVDGNEYIDFQSGLGAIILGVSFPAVNKAIAKQLNNGVLYSFSSTLGIQVAEKLCTLIPSAERVRILRNGSDATSAAVRIARAYTQRDKIVSGHFHGWHDWYYVSTTLNRGIPPSLKNDLFSFSYNKIESLKRIFERCPHDIAAVIMEPVKLDSPLPGFLEEVKEITQHYGALLIFDEVVTGFRFGLGGAQAYFGVTPDLTTLAKGLANGSPLSAVAGKKDIMDTTGDVMTSMTYAEENLSLAASLATLQILEREPVVKHIWELGTKFKNGFNALARQYNVPIFCVGLPPRLELVYENHKQIGRKYLKSYFLAESANRGILFGLHIFMNYSHTQEQINKALHVCESLLQTIGQAAANKDLSFKGEVVTELW